MRRTKTLPALWWATAAAVASLPTAFGDSKDKPLSLAFLTKSSGNEFWANLEKLPGH